MASIIESRPGRRQASDRKKLKYGVLARNASRSQCLNAATNPRLPMSDPQITPAPQDENQLIAERREKLKALREAQAQGGAVAFPNNFKPEDHAATLLAAHGAKTAEELAAEGTAPITAKIAGRMMLKRVMGKASFATLQDSTGRFQIYVTRDDIGEERYAAFKHWDLGDIVGAEGHLFKYPHRRAVDPRHQRAPADQEPAPHARQVPWHRRPGGQIPSALCGPDDR
jgi:hypothetical protein